MIDNLYKKHNVFKIILGIIFLLIYATGTVLAGGSIVGLIKFIVGCTVYVFLPGRAIYHALNMDEYFPVNGRWHSLYYVFGMAFLMFVYVAGKTANAVYIPIAILLAISVFTARTKPINGPKKTTTKKVSIYKGFEHL